MTRDNLKKIKKEIRKENDEFYGEETESGSQPRPTSDDDVEDDLAKVVGSDVKKGIRGHKPFNIGDEIENDEPETDREDEE